MIMTDISRTVVYHIRNTQVMNTDTDTSFVYPVIKRFTTKDNVTIQGQTYANAGTELPEIPIFAFDSSGGGGTDGADGKSITFATDMEFDWFGDLIIGGLTNGNFVKSAKTTTVGPYDAWFVKLKGPLYELNPANILERSRVQAVRLPSELGDHSHTRVSTTPGTEQANTYVYMTYLKQPTEHYDASVVTTIGSRTFSEGARAKFEVYKVPNVPARKFSAIPKQTGNSSNSYTWKWLLSGFDDKFATDMSFTIKARNKASGAIDETYTKFVSITTTNSTQVPGTTSLLSKPIDDYSQSQNVRSNLDYRELFSVNVNLPRTPNQPIQQTQQVRSIQQAQPTQQTQTITRNNRSKIGSTWSLRF
jgi:hypothetical protein